MGDSEQKNTVNRNYSQIQNILENQVEYIKLIQERDNIFSKKLNLPIPNEKLLLTQRNDIISERENLFADIEFLNDQIDKRNIDVDILQKSLDFADEKFEDHKTAMNKEKNKKKKEVELKHRQYQILQYQNFLNEETIQLLWLLMVVLVICCIIVLGSILSSRGFNKMVTLSLIFAFLVFYGIYVFKRLVIDNINVNIYDYHEYDYSKPTSDEITRGKELEDKLYRLRDHSQSGNQCTPESITPKQAEIIKDEELQKVKDDIGKFTSESGKCLIYS